MGEPVGRWRSQDGAAAATVGERLHPALDAHGVRTLRLRGRLDFVNVPALERFLRRHLCRGREACHVVADLSLVSFVDSSFLRLLLGLARRHQAARRELVLVAPRGQVARVLALVGLPNLVPTYPDVAAAAAALAAGRWPLIPPRFAPSGTGAWDAAAARPGDAAPAAEPAPAPAGGRRRRAALTSSPVE